MKCSSNLCESEIKVYGNKWCPSCHNLYANFFDLKSCPFCGGPPVVITRKIGGSVFDFKDIPKDGYDAESFVFCHECGCEGGHSECYVFDANDCQTLEINGVINWQERDDRSSDAFDLSVRNGLNRYPRLDLPKAN